MNTIPAWTEPWDGPAAIAFTDGRYVGATLDRNGLRPARYMLTDDGTVILASEVGVLDIDESKIVKKERLHPGKMLLIDTEKGRIIDDDELKTVEAGRHPYESWLTENLSELDSLTADTAEDSDWHSLVGNIKGGAETPAKAVKLKRVSEIEKSFAARSNEFADMLPFLQREKVFGYTWEDVNGTLKSMAEKADDPISAMGIDSPIAVLSEKPQLLYNYFKQLFAQVTNPPIDAIREQVVTSSLVYLGGESNILEPSGENCRLHRLTTPVLTDEQLQTVKSLDTDSYKAITRRFYLTQLRKATFPPPATVFLKRLTLLFQKAITSLSCPTACSARIMRRFRHFWCRPGLHHHLISRGTRMKVSIVLESGEPREVHHLAVLVGYGVNAVCPYMAYEILDRLSEEKLLELDKTTAKENYIKALTKGIVKIASKMGISTVQSYKAHRSSKRSVFLRNLWTSTLPERLRA